MLFNPMSLVEAPLPVLGVLFIVLFGKSLAAYAIVLVFRHPVATALTISASLAQIGEFSFILAELGVRLGLLPEKGRDLILAGAILSILLNPLMFAGVNWIKPYLERGGAAVSPADGAVLAAAGELASPAVVTVAKATELTDHTVLIGYGRVGSLVGQALRADGQAFLVIEDSDKAIARLQAEGIEVIAGNGAKPEILKAANVAGARHLVVAIPNTFEAGQALEQGRAANAGLQIVARAHSDAEVEHLTALGADVVIMGEREIARGMIRIVSRPREPGAEGPSAAAGPVIES